MKKLFVKLVGLSIGLSILACEDIPEFHLDDTIPVVEAFLYAGDPVSDIKVTEVLPFESDQAETMVADLEITIENNGTEYQLSSSENGGYYYEGKDLQINSGETYKLSFEYEGNEISSYTTIPSAPTGLHLSAYELDIPQVEELLDIKDLAQSGNNNVNVGWDNPSGDYYFLVIENIDESPEPIDLNNILDFNFEFTSTPTQNDFFTLAPFVHYTQFGLHRIILYRVNEEYALLYETIEQDSRNLNEPYTNIDNGVGIFSGFASDTVYLEIYKQ